MQTLPRSRRVLASLRPTWELPGIAAIEPSFLRANGIAALIWDVDGTITHRHACEPAPETEGALERLLNVEWLEHAVLSNCDDTRFAQLADMFPRMRVVKGYQGADGALFRIRRGAAEEWTIPARGELRALRKPDPAPVRFLVELLGVSPDAVALVGDQHLTDIAAANLAGVRSIKVPTLGPGTFPAAVRALQRLDALLYRMSG
jgi:predicted HAD superfamily phosphohydrolase YqeG